MFTSRYILGFFIAIGLLIIAIIIVTSGGKKTIIGSTPLPLTSYANTDAVVQMSINGPITAAQNHFIVNVDVSKNSAVYSQIQGYDGNVIKTEAYPNSVNGYRNFLAALDNAGFTNGNNSQALANDEGYCASGSRYVFSLTEGGKLIQRYWATNCVATKRTYLGQLSATTSLFQAQIPNYGDLTQSIGLF